MQAGVTDINTIRIYSAVKQGLEKDPQGEFVKRWVPELAEIPAPLIHLPWRVSAMEHMMYQVNIGTDYPAPIVDLSETYKAAQSLLWQWRTKPEVNREVYRLIQRHVRPD
jgi:deoxyribodipyrimidine photo-lyase